MNADGSGNTLIFPGVRCNWPIWSPHGDRIAFTVEAVDYPSPNIVHVVDQDGSHPVEVFTGVGAAALNWHWSGDRLMVSTPSSGYSVQADGSSFSAVATGPWSRWFPLSDKVTYRAADGVWLADPDGTSRKKLFNVPTYYYAWPRIPLFGVFGTSRSSNSEIATVNMLSGLTTRLVTLPHMGVAGPISITADGSRAVFQAYSVTLDTWHNYLLDVGRGTLVRIPSDSAMVDYMCPVITDDGGWIFVQSRGGGGPIIALRSDFTESVTITGGTRDRYPQWKP